MSPSGGSSLNRHQMATSTLLLSPTLVVVAAAVTVMLCTLPGAEAVIIAREQYYMDQNRDCYLAGYQEVPRDQVIKIIGRSDPPGTRTERCTIMFQPQIERDLIRVTLERGSTIPINATEVEFAVTMLTESSQGGGSISLNALSRPEDLPKELESLGGRVSMTMTLPEDKRVPFQVHLTVLVKKAIEGSIAGGSSTTMAIAIGVVIAIIVLLVIIALIIVFFKKKRRQDQDKTDSGRPTKAFERVDYHPHYNEKTSSTGSTLSLSHDKRSIEF